MKRNGAEDYINEEVRKNVWKRTRYRERERKTVARARVIANSTMSISFQDGVNYSLIAIG